MYNIYRSIFLSTFLGITILGANLSVGSGQAAAMSEAEEIEIGKKAHKAILQKYRVYNNPGLQKYIAYVGNKLAEKGDRPHLKYSFLVLDSEEVNAFALPGGYIYITRGLMAYLNNEAELAAVLGHEIGHVTGRHAAKQESASKIAKAGSALAAILGSLYVPGLDPNIGYDIASTGSSALLSGYGRDHELESDQIGAHLLAKTGYDPQAMLDVIATLKNQESYEFKLARLEERRPHAYHGLFASHPDSDTRLQEVIGTANSLKTDTPTYSGSDAYQNLTNGLSYGQNVRTGVVVNRGLYHGPLGYAILFPKRWLIDKSSNTVNAKPQAGQALIQINYFTANPKISPRDFMVKKLGVSGLRNDKSMTINKLPAHTGIAVIDTPYGRRLSRITLIYFGRRAYLISGTTKDTRGLNRYDDEFLETAKSFRPMSRQERMAARQLRIRLIQANDQTTYKSLAANSPLQHLAEEQLRLLNGDYPRGKIESGEMVKIVQ